MDNLNGSDPIRLRYSALQKRSEKSKKKSVGYLGRWGLCTQTLHHCASIPLS